MKYLSALSSGILVWIGVSLSFYLLEKVPVVKDSFYVQSAITAFLIIFFAIGSARLFYRKNEMNGLKLGIIMSVTALVLDVLITVPFVEIPNGRSYESFFTSPVLWILAFINAISVYLWKRNQYRKK